MAILKQQKGEREEKTFKNTRQELNNQQPI